MKYFSRFPLECVHVGAFPWMSEPTFLSACFVIVVGSLFTAWSVGAPRGAGWWLRRSGGGRQSACWALVPAVVLAVVGVIRLLGPCVDAI